MLEIGSIGCRRSLARHRRARWRLAFLGTFITALLTALFINQGDLFHPDRWDKGKVPIWIPVIMISSAAAIFAFIASAIVVSVFRSRFRDEKDLV